MSFSRVVLFWGRILQSGTTVLVSLVFGFVRLSEIPLDARFWIVGGATTLFWLTVVLAIHQALSTKKSRRRFCASVLVLLLISAGAGLLLELVTRYHTLRIIPGQLEVDRGTFLIYPPRTPVSAKFSFHPSPPDVRITELNAQTLTPAHLPAGVPTVDGTYIDAKNLYFPQQVAVSYRLSGPASVTYLVSTVEPLDVPILSEEQLWAFRYWFIGFSVCLFVLGCLASLYSSHS